MVSGVVIFLRRIARGLSSNRAGRIGTLALGLAAAGAFPASAQDGGAGATGLWVFCGVLSVLFLGALGAVFYLWQVRNRAEDARRIFTGALGAQPGARVIIGPDGAALASSPAWRVLVGYDSRAPLTELERHVGDDRSRPELERLRAAAAAGLGAETDLVSSAGGDERVRVSVEPVEGQPGYALWTLHPHGAEHPGTSVSFAMFEKLAAGMAGAPVGLYTVDRDGRFVFVNDELARWFGTTPAALVDGDARLHDFLDGADAACPPYAAFVTGDDGAPGRARFRSAGGQILDAGVVQELDRGAGEADLQVRAIVRNLGAGFQDIETNRLAEERFRDMFDVAPFGVVQLDVSGAIVDTNAAFAEIFATERADCAGHSLADFIAEEDRERVTAWLGQAAARKRAPDPLEAKAVGADAAAVSLFVGRIEGAGEAPAGLVVYALNMSVQRSLETQVLQSQKMELVGQLAGGVAHDFNNLLTAMIGFCDLLLLRHSPKDQSFADIMQIKQNANRAANLVRQLLAFSRQQTLQPKILDPTDVLSEISHLLRRLIGARITLELVHKRDVGMVRVDQGQFEQVIINLAVNARDAMGDGGTLTIRTFDVPADDPRIKMHKEMPQGDYVAIEVADTGTGIPKDIQNKIFEPFFTTKEVGSGTGLGLSTVYGIVKQTGGYIYVDSVRGEGATFIIYLPRHGRGETVRDIEAEAESNKKRDLTGAGTVLLVEDEDAVRLFGARALRNKGYNVIDVDNGEDAIDILDAGEETVDLLITDVVMPGIDGPTLIRLVREKHPDMKVIFISGYTEDTFRKRLDAGAEVHFLPKPFSLQDLAGKVKEVMHEDV